MNEEKYTGNADIYSMFRPSYPDALYDYLYSEIGFARESTIADVGAGTGIFTRPLLARGSIVFAIEPNKDMHGVLAKHLSEYTSFTPLHTSAEKTGLPSQSVDFVTVAQALHWFDPQLFRQECRRILKPDGKIVVVRNDSRDADANTLRKNDGIIAFFDGNCTYKTFQNRLTENREHFIGRSLSKLDTPGTGCTPEEYNAFVQTLNDFFDEHSLNGLLYTHLVTKSYVGGITRFE